jgi:hypothetical protein
LLASRQDSGAKAHYDGIVAFSQTDFTEDLKKITVPVFVMHGDDDQIVPGGCHMIGLRGWIIFAWIALPTVMYGGYSLIELIKRGNVLTPEQIGFFRAGHAHAGVLTLMSLLYYTFLDQTSLLLAIKHTACAALVIGILAQSGGFFIHLSPARAALGTRITLTGAAILVCAILVLVYGLITAV